MIVAAGIDWTNVIVALIAGLPAIIAAIAAVSIHQKIATPSGTAIGKQVESALHTALANNYHLRGIGDAVNAPQSRAGTSEAEQVPDLPEGTGP